MLNRRPWSLTIRRRIPWRYRLHRASPVDIEIAAGDAVGAVESVKSASDILTPIGGKVTEVNSVLEEKPAPVNKNPEGEGWIAKFEVSGEPEEKLMSKEEYAAFTDEALRL